MAGGEDGLQIVQILYPQRGGAEGPQLGDDHVFEGERRHRAKAEIHGVRLRPLHGVGQPRYRREQDVHTRSRRFPRGAPDDHARGRVRPPDGEGRSPGKLCPAHDAGLEPQRLDDGDRRLFAL